MVYLPVFLKIFIVGVLLDFMYKSISSFLYFQAKFKKNKFWSYYLKKSFDNETPPPIHVPVGASNLGLLVSGAVEAQNLSVYGSNVSKEACGRVNLDRQKGSRNVSWASRRTLCNTKLATVLTWKTDSHIPNL